MRKTQPGRRRSLFPSSGNGFLGGSKEQEAAGVMLCGQFRSPAHSSAYAKHRGYSAGVNSDVARHWSAWRRNHHRLPGGIVWKRRQRNCHAVVESHRLSGFHCGCGPASGHCPWHARRLGGILEVKSHRLANRPLERHRRHPSHDSWILSHCIHRCYSPPHRYRLLGTRLRSQLSVLTEGTENLRPHGRPRSSYPPGLLARAIVALDSTESCFQRICARATSGVPDFIARAPGRPLRFNPRTEKTDWSGRSFCKSFCASTERGMRSSSIVRDLI